MMGGTLLALIIALGSFAIYFSAFFFPEVHRKSDFYWSGLGFFYALVLWICSGRITGAVLLGQTASVALLVWFGTQTLMLRRNLASPEEKTRISENVASSLKNLSPLTLWQKIRGSKTQATSKVAPETKTKASEETETTPSPENETPEETAETQSSPSSQQQTTETTQEDKTETEKEETKNE